MTANILARTYFDRCTIYRETTFQVGSLTRHEAVKQYSDIPCALSQGKAQITGANVSLITSTHKLFLSPTVAIQKGDRIDVRQQGSSNAVTYLAGEPFIYQGSHIEVELTRHAYQ